MQSRRFESWIFGLATDVDAWAGLPHNLLCLGLSLVKIQCQRLFLFCCWSSCSHVTRCCLTSLGFNSYGTQCSCFWIISNAFKCFKTVVWSTPNDSASSVCTWYQSSWGNASNSSSSNFFGVHSLSSTSKSLFLKHLNQSLLVISYRASLL